MTILERLRKPFLGKAALISEQGHLWQSTGVVLLLSADRRLERCANCHTYRIKGQVDWEKCMDGSGEPETCPGTPPYPWEA